MRHTRQIVVRGRLVVEEEGSTAAVQNYAVFVVVDAGGAHGRGRCVIRYEDRGATRGACGADARAHTRALVSDHAQANSQRRALGHVDVTRATAHVSNSQIASTSIRVHHVCLCCNAVKRKGWILLC